MDARVLTINGGSSSLKFALFQAGPEPRRLLSGAIERIGLEGSRLKVRSAGEPNAGGAPTADQTLADQAVAAPDQASAAKFVLDWLSGRGQLDRVQAVGHRIVHGGPRYLQSELITPEMLAELERLSPIDPAHLPGEIALIEFMQARLSQVPQVACFDTAFHRDLPRVAQILPIPRQYESAGLRRYGFHGLSFTYLMQALRRIAGPEAARGRVVLAHLGAGASLAAVRDGKCIDTSMAFTPTAGLVMATRSGDLDPGVLVYLMRENQLSADQIDDLVNRRSGLVGISETSADMRDLLARQTSDIRAAEAVDVFCYQAKKWIGAYAAALGGIDTLVFAGGIGEHAAEVRQRICAGLEFLGLRLDTSRNTAGAALISADGAACTVRVIPTDEESVIVADVQKLCPQLRS
jgi:acetate kinase